MSQQPKRLGDILKELNFVKDAHIEVALKIQSVRRSKLGEILLSTGFISPKELAIALSTQSGIPYIDLNDYFPSEDVLKLIDRRTAESLPALAVDKRGDSVVVVITDPFNERAKAIVRNILRGYKVEFRLAEETVLRKSIEKFYSYYTEPIEEVIKKEVSKPASGVNFDFLLEKIIQLAAYYNASDIHINPIEDVSFLFMRIDGIMQPIQVIPKPVHYSLVSVIKLKGDMNVAERRIPQDGAFSINAFGEEIDVRVSTLPTAFGEKVVMRLLRKDISKLNLQFLGYHEKQLKLIYEAINLPFGMVIVSGPTGSGKSTTLYSMLRSVDYLKKNVVTVEDPIEYKFNFIYQTEVNTSAGYKFSTALKYFMRQDPDVILVGEIRDEETAEISVEASNTGHLLLSTVHANDAITSVKRLLSLSSRKDVTLAVLRYVIAQRLVRKLCPFCKEETTAENLDIPALREFLSSVGVEIENIRMFRRKGCEHCRGTGYLGRTVVAEVMELTPEIADRFFIDAPLTEIRSVLKTMGFISLQVSGLIKLLSGETDIDELDRVVGLRKFINEEIVAGKSLV
jgi:type IV pilus assembly protein PilB